MVRVPPEASCFAFTLEQPRRTNRPVFPSMGITFNAHLLGWSFAPLRVLDDERHADALSSQGLALDFIPASLRRRCSSFSRVTLAVAHAASSAAHDDVATSTVFASAHGEGDVTKQLLVDIANSQPMSPMGFSLSVHNAASGLYSIASGNRAPSTAIAAGEDTFLMGLCEALMTLREGKVRRVLYVCSDDQVPSIFLREGSSGGVPHAIAMLLGTEAGDTHPIISVAVDSAEDKGERGSLPSALKFARWLRRQEGDGAIASCAGVWRFSLSGSSSEGCFVSLREASV